MAIVGRERAGLFVDSRYTLQAPAETDTTLVTIFEAPPATLAAEIATFVPQDGRIGYDPWLHTPGEIKELAAKLEGKASLVPTANLVDRIWTDRPAAPNGPVEFLGPNRAGKTTGRGNGWTRSRVCILRNHRGIAPYRNGERSERGEMTLEEAAVVLKVSEATVRRLINLAVLPARQLCKGAPWVIRSADLESEEVQGAAADRRLRRPQSQDDRQNSMAL